MEPNDRHTLLRYARHCISTLLSKSSNPILPEPQSSALCASGAAFVTLRVAGDLRGCIGHPVAVQPLWKSVLEMAAAAATRDHRFKPLSPRDSYAIEISVLSPQFPVSPADVQVGLHGLYVQYKNHAGLLLPHVALEHHWTADEFVHELLKKAAVPETALYDPEIRLYAFTTETFSDSELVS